MFRLAKPDGMAKRWLHRLATAGGRYNRHESACLFGVICPDGTIAEVIVAPCANIEAMELAPEGNQHFGRRRAPVR
jgi:hypothetical protein